MFCLLWKKKAASHNQSPLPINMDWIKFISLQRLLNRRKHAKSNATVEAPPETMNRTKKGSGPIFWIPAVSDCGVEHLGNDSICCSNSCSSPLCVKYMIASEISKAKGDPLGNTCKMQEEDQNIKMEMHLLQEHVHSHFVIKPYVSMFVNLRIMEQLRIRKSRNMKLQIQSRWAYMLVLPLWSLRSILLEKFWHGGWTRKLPWYVHLIELLQSHQLKRWFWCSLS